MRSYTTAVTVLAISVGLLAGAFILHLTGHENVPCVVQGEAP